MPDRRDWKPRAVAHPESGYFLIRLVRGGPQVPARIRFARGLWSAVINGAAFTGASDPVHARHVFAIWHGGQWIDESEYWRRLALSRAARANDPLATPGRAIDLARLPPLF